MAKQQCHIIDKQTIVLQLPPGANAFALQQQASRVFWETVAPALEALFDRYAKDDELVSIEKLQVDLGFLNEENWEQDFPARALACIEEALRERTSSPQPRSGMTVQPLHLGYFQQWLHFLEFGYLPWGAAIGTHEAALQKNVLDSLATEVDALRRLRLILAENRTAFERLLRQHPEPFLVTLATVFTARPQESLGVFQQNWAALLRQALSLPGRPLPVGMSAWIQAHQPGFPFAFWQHILETVIVEGQQLEALPLIESFLRKAVPAGHLSVLHKTAMAMNLEQQACGLPPQPVAEKTTASLSGASTVASQPIPAPVGEAGNEAALPGQHSQTATGSDPGSGPPTTPLAPAETSSTPRPGPDRPQLPLGPANDSSPSHIPAEQAKETGNASLEATHLAAPDETFSMQNDGKGQSAATIAADQAWAIAAPVFAEVAELLAQPTALPENAAATGVVNGEGTAGQPLTAQLPGRETAPDQLRPAAGELLAEGYEQKPATATKDTTALPERGSGGGPAAVEKPFQKEQAPADETMEAPAPPSVEAAPEGDSPAVPRPVVKQAPADETMEATAPPPVKTAPEGDAAAVPGPVKQAPADGTMEATAPPYVEAAPEGDSPAVPRPVVKQAPADETMEATAPPSGKAAPEGERQNAAIVQPTNLSSPLNHDAAPTAAFSNKHRDESSATPKDLPLATSPPADGQPKRPAPPLPAQPRQKPLAVAETGTFRQPKPAFRLGQDNRLFIRYAGLVLVHPYLPTFFKGLGLVAGKDFLDDASRHRAIHLLHYLTTNETALPEFMLLLPKLLCGMPFEEPMERYVALSETERAECEDLLRAVVQHWGALGKSSPAALQEGFLRRDGKLEQSADGWKLTVERQTLDVLLGKLPWGLGIIKLPWMKDILKVEWG